MTIAIIPEAFASVPARDQVVEKGDRFINFLAMNNIRAYLKEGEHMLDPNRVNDVLLVAALSETLGAVEFRHLAFTIRRLTLRQIGTGAAMELLARAMGYRTYGLANFCRFPDGHIENVWEHSATADAHPVLLDDEGLARQFRNYADNPRIRELYTLHNAFNREKSAAKKARFQERKAEREQRREAQQ